MKKGNPGDKIALKLTAAERTLVEGPLSLPPGFKRLIESTPPSEPVMLLPDSLVALGTYVGAGADHTPDKKLQKTMAALFQKILRLLSAHKSSKGGKVHGFKRTKLIAGQAIAPTKKPARTKKPTDTVYQFKITLLEIQPPIWRRIQVKDGTLDKLHEYIQTAMGWTNSHLHQFKIGEQLYGDPMLMEENFEEMEYKDSTTTVLSDILPKTGKFRFVYEYDFGDGWEHEVLFEGCPKAEPGRKYPVCLEGQRACPPEDVGGTGGYEEFLKAVQDKNHEEREAMLEWDGGWFDPEEFDPVTATKSMKKGLPDWRKEERI